MQLDPLRYKEELDDFLAWDMETYDHIPIETHFPLTI